jgi:hypothetical protein
VSDTLRANHLVSKAKQKPKQFDHFDGYYLHDRSSQQQHEENLDQHCSVGHQIRLQLAVLFDTLMASA